MTSSRSKFGQAKVLVDVGVLQVGLSGRMVLVKDGKKMFGHHLFSFFFFCFCPLCLQLCLPKNVTILFQYVLTEFRDHRRVA